MDLNNRIIHSSITDGTKVNAFKTHFPDMSSIVDEVIASPKCGICAKKLMDGIVKTTNFKTQLELVYGSPITGNITINNQTMTRQVKRMSEVEWETFFKNSRIPPQGSFIYFNPTTNEVVVSYNENTNNPTTVAIT